MKNTNCLLTPRILIVDDREENLYVLRELIQGLDSSVDVVQALSGMEALRILAEDSDFCLILMDVQMPDLDGFQTTGLIRRYKHTKDTPVIFITAIFKDVAYIHHGFDSGAVDYICKPIDDKVLLSKVKIFIDLYKSKKALESSLEKSREIEERQNLILSHSQDGIVVFDKFGKVLFLNPTAEDILGHESESVESLMLSDIVSREEGFGREWSASDVCEAVEKGVSFRSLDSSVTTAGGQKIPCSYSFGSFDSQAYSGGVLIFQDITQRKKHEENLVYMATHDPLTNLPNRILFKESVNNAIARAQRSSYKLVVMFIDLDHFKKVNDELGHNVGDELLKKICRRLQSIGRKVDLFARLGGDEFGVVFEDINNNFDSHKMAPKILKAFEEPIDALDHSILISGSVGVVEYPEYGRDADSLIKAADIAMYQAKSQGRNCYALFRPELEDSAIARSQLERDFRLAISREQLICHYQPILNATDMSIAAIEVLVRWEHPKRGLVSPAEFISVAEHTGQVVEMSNQVFSMALASLADWEAKGLWPRSAKIALNVSALQLARDILIGQLKSMGDRYTFSFSNVEIEITESMLMQDAEESARILESVREMGLSISIDDFGTGYSSLNYLRRLPINVLKIDRSFVKDIGHDRSDEQIINATIDLAHNLNLKVVSEGVETETQMAFLKDAGSDYLQGFHLSKPLSRSAMEEWLESESRRKAGIQGGKLDVC
ncbi:two-component system response regulator [Pseudoteredinibacter isoporae]|uniref:Diguanylate cyclase (GGDEF)-like protein/PAS domain S-box-containing protein n=1 Tax=Pseudoteredinibacter isoporae TaxID=570281 RepID=A0A7X0JY62_9GAMM|nr:EAL domain-containing protein [Pseudoteredinibacter isoporae]MBB6523883.1 diguanylate cyclase (GGDEF)-like protein/PAS domain S-box-containing protein [Pseudoteredinibacter isoporae]NHO89255.1 EAL domain-containing protein [Pseudoteredinibacter isoporae]NIB22060.1 EAL domain-containing protein [Pseudoteredinibacter isoporae]